MPYRLRRILLFPFHMILAKLAPVAFARLIGVRIEGKVTIYGSAYVMFSAEPYLVTLKDNVFISVGAQFICHDGGVLPFRKDEPTLDLAAPIVVGENSFIGMKAVILPGVTIGPNSVVGAYAVVTRDVEAGTIVAGNPARAVSTTQAFLDKARKKSLGIGHLPPLEKARRYKEIFGLQDGGPGR